MKRGAWTVVALAAASLVVAAWITSSTATPVFTSPAQPGPRNPVPESSGGQQTQAADPEGSAAESGDLPLSIVITLYVVLGLLLVALLMVFIGRAQARRRRRRRAAGDFADPVDDDELAPEQLSAALAAAVAARLAAMATGTPRNAIVRSWLDLEETVAAAGLSRDPALTAAEFTREVLARYDVDQAAIATLSDLYREARFSEHELTEEHREDAITALESLQAQLPAHAVVDAEPS